MTMKRGFTVTPHTLASLEAFSSLSSNVLAEIAPLFSYQQYTKGDKIIRQHEADKRVCFIISGSVRVTYYSLNGKEVSFRDVQVGQMFGELTALDGGRRSAEVLAQRNTSVAWLSAENFIKLLNTLPTFSEYVFRRLVKLIRLLSERIIEVGSLSVNYRIHAELLRLARAGDVRGNVVAIRPSPNRDEFASRISTVRFAVSKEISELVRAGVLEKAPGALVVRDLKALESMVQLDHRVD